MEQQPPSILDTIMSTKQAEELSHFRPTEVLSKLFHELKSRERDVLIRRFGLFGHEKETLEHIGVSLKVTRERIRQIERLAIESIKKAKASGQILEPVIHVLRGILEEHGDILEEQFLLTTAITHLPPTPEEKSALRFLLLEVLSDTFPHSEETAEWKAAWALRLPPPTLVARVQEEAKKFFQERTTPAEKDELFKHLHGCSLTDTGAEKPSDFVFESYCRLSCALGENIFDAWGLAEWPTITPKRMNDKIFLVLEHEEKPLHFQVITQKINEAHFDGKVAHPATIHNELILDKRYVLVGRGLYALKAWGFRPGVVADIIEAVLQDAGKPMTKQDILAAVLKERFVAESTIFLALTNKERFERLPDGTYQRRTAVTPHSTNNLTLPGPAPTRSA